MTNDIIDDILNATSTKKISSQIPEINKNLKLKKVNEADLKTKLDANSFLDV